MTQAALNGADVVLLTSDNPRTENPDQIFADMKAGIDFSNRVVHEIHDRREAIKFAVQQAQAGDIVVIAGKGHENYQEMRVFGIGLTMSSKCNPRLMHSTTLLILLILHTKEVICIPQQPAQCL